MSAIAITPSAPAGWQFDEDRTRTAADKTARPVAIPERLQTATLSTISNLVAQEALPPWWRSVLQRIRTLQQLEDNWDGYGGEPLSQTDARRGLEFLAAITMGRRGTPEPFIAPIHSGLQIEWDGPETAIEIEIRQDGSHVILERAGQTVFDGPLREGLPIIFALLEQISAPAG